VTGGGRLVGAQGRPGDAWSLAGRLRGTGQVEAITRPSLAVDGLRILQPEVDQHTTVQSERVGGEKSVRWLIVPERAGTFVLGPFRWAVFDPATQAWSVAEAPALTLTAAGNPTQPATSGVEPVEPEVGDPTDDETASFGPVRTESVFARRSARVASSLLYLLALAVGPLALALTALASLVRKRRATQAAAGAGERRARDARRKLDEADAAIVARDTRGLYGTVTQSIRGALEARLGHAIGSLTHGELKRMLAERGMAVALAKRIAEELEGAEMARFSSAGGEESEMRAALGRARELVAEIQRFVPTEDDE